MPFLLVKLLRICNNFLEFNCLQFCVLFKSVFFKDSFGSRRWLSTRWKSWFFPSSVKENKAKEKAKQGKRKELLNRYYLAKNRLCKKPRSVIYSVSQSVGKTDYQSIFRLAAKLGAHIAVSETVNQLFWRLTSICSVSWSSSQLVGWKVAQSFWSKSQTVSQSAG